MAYYIETCVAPHGRRHVLGGQATDGKPLVMYATKADAEAAVAAEHRRVSGDMAKTLWVDNPRMPELNIQAIDQLRLVGRDGYMHL